VAHGKKGKAKDERRGKELGREVRHGFGLLDANLPRLS
jgi:hypothetical protein